MSCYLEGTQPGTPGPAAERKWAERLWELPGVAEESEVPVCSCWLDPFRGLSGEKAWWKCRKPHHSYQVCSAKSVNTTRRLKDTLGFYLQENHDLSRHDITWYNLISACGLEPMETPQYQILPIQQPSKGEPEHQLNRCSNMTPNTSNISHINAGKGLQSQSRSWSQSRLLLIVFRIVWRDQFAEGWPDHFSRNI